jgi:hypothetical protein
MAAAKDVGVSLHLEADVLPVRVSEVQLRRLCLILIDNALKYTPAGGRHGPRADHREAGRGPERSPSRRPEQDRPGFHVLCPFPKYRAVTPRAVRHTKGRPCLVDAGGAVRRR